MLLYQFDTFFDPQIRCVLIETNGKKPAGVTSPSSKPFKEKHASYIDVHLNTNTVDDAKEFDLKSSDLDNMDAPADFPDKHLWKKLRKINDVVKANGKSIPNSNVGP